MALVGVVGCPTQCRIFAGGVTAAFSRPSAPQPVPSRRPQPAAPAASSARRLCCRVACAAATEQGQDGKINGHREGIAELNRNSISGNYNGWTDSVTSSSTDPLLQHIAACTTASQLHQLLLRHSAELRGPDVAAALEAAAKRKLLNSAGSTDGDTAAGGGRASTSSSSSGHGSNGASSDSSASSATLAALLVQLAAAHAPCMQPASLAAAAWSLGTLQLQPARPVLRAMHSLAHEQLVDYSPAQLCALMWAGSALDPGFRSPLFAALAGLLEQGMSLSLFAPHDLAMLAWLCGREGGGVAKDVLVQVVGECRSRLDLHRAVLEQIEQQRGVAEAIAVGQQMPGISWVHDTPVDEAVPALGVRMRVNAWKRMITEIKSELLTVTAGQVLVEVQLQMCNRQELNPLVLAIMDKGRFVDKPLRGYAGYKFSQKKLAFRLVPRMHGLQQAAERAPRSNNSSSGVSSESTSDRASDSTRTEGDRISPLALLSREEAAAVLKECQAAGMFWEALTPRARRVSVQYGAASFIVFATLASGRRLQLTWRRQAHDLLPLEVAELPPLEGTPAAAHDWVKQAEQQQPQQPQQPHPPAPSLPTEAPPPPFGPQQAAMLLSGLGQLKMRVDGIVEPLLKQCLPELRQAPADDVARILIALGELHMEPASELLVALVERLSTARDALSPRQVVSIMWAACKVSRWLPRIISIGVRHLTIHLAAYRTVDLVGMLWACGQLNGTVPDATLAAVLQRLPPKELQQCSTPALCNLVWALGKLVAVRTGSEQRGKNAGIPGRKAAAAGARRWLLSTAGVETQAVTLAAANELAQRSSQLGLHDLSSAAVALAAHSSHLALLPAHAVVALRGACTAAAAADAFSPSDLTNLALAAARLHWDEAAFLDSLASSLFPCVSALLQPGEVVRALAGLAPASYGPLFASLAHSYISRLKHRLHHAGVSMATAELEERAGALVAFAVVAQAQGLPKEVLLDLVHTVVPAELKNMGAAGQVALLELAAQAGLKRSTSSVQAICTGIRSSVDGMSADMLRQTWHALRRLRRYDPELVAAVDACISRLPPPNPPQLL